MVLLFKPNKNQPKAIVQMLHIKVLRYLSTRKVRKFLHAKVNEHSKEKNKQSIY